MFYSFMRIYVPICLIFYTFGCGHDEEFKRRLQEKKTELPMRIINRKEYKEPNFFFKIFFGGLKCVTDPQTAVRKKKMSELNRTND